MLSFGSFEPAGVLLFLLEVTLKGSLVLAAAGLATSLLKSSSAALRHTIWTMAILAVAAMPLVVATTPRLDVGVLPASTSVSELAGPRVQAGEFAAGLDRLPEPRAVAGNRPEVLPAERPAAEVTPTWASATTTSIQFDWRWALIVVWLVGAGIVALRFGLGWFGLRRIKRKTEPVADVRFRLAAIRLARSIGIRRQVGLVWGEPGSMPLTWGLFKQAISLPGDARDWEADRVIAVMTHELAHIKRRDCLVQTLVHVACAVYWFNPLVWMAASASRRDREMACDDYVLRSGTAGTEYADHLLQIARTLRTPRMTSAASIAMARPSELEGRLLAILNPTQSRSETSRPVYVAAIGALAAFSIPLAALQPVPSESIQAVSVSEMGVPRTDVVARPAVQPVPVPSVSVMPTEQDPALQAQYIREANELVEQAARTLESIERLRPAAVEWQERFDSEAIGTLTPSVLDKVVKGSDKLTLDEIRRLKAAGVDVDFIQELRQAGLADLTVDELISMAHADVDGDFIYAMSAAGYNGLTATELVQLRYADVEPDDLAVWSALGYNKLSTDELIRLAHADVDADFVVAMASVGYGDLDPYELVRLSHADIDAEFVLEMGAIGLEDLSPDDLIRLGHADVEPWYVKSMQAAVLDEIDVDEMIRMAHADIDVEYVEQMADAGLEKLDVDELVRLAHANVDEEFVEKALELGVEANDVSEIIRLRYMDIDIDDMRSLSRSAQ